MPILNIITAKGKALRSKKLSHDVNANDADQEILMQDDVVQDIPDPMDIDDDDPVRSAFRMIMCAHTTAGSDCNARGC